MFSRWLIKQLFNPPRSTGWNNRLPGTNIDYQAKVGEGFGSSVVMAPVHWIARTFPQAELTITIDGEAQPDHPITNLLNSPNPFYSGDQLEQATIFSYVLSGNAYWLIVRDKRTLRPIELWYTPHWMIRPIAGTGGSDFITHYEYRPRGVNITVDPKDVCHLRYGLDPQNVRLGISPLASLWREIFTDDEAANFTAVMLKNMGAPGIIISPSSPGVGADEVNTVRAYVRERLTGDRRGEPLVLSASTNVEQSSFSPREMTLSALRNVPEERVCAVLGVPAAVVGFGTGLQQTKVGATLKEYEAQAWHANLIPMGMSFAREIERCLVPEFLPATAKLKYDTSKVEALRESQNELVERTTKMFQAGLITRAAALKRLGTAAILPRDDVFFVPSQFIEVPAGSPPPKQAAPAKPGGQKQDAPLPLIPPPRRRITSAQKRLHGMLLRHEQVAAQEIEADLLKIFDRLGVMAAESARRFVAGKDTLDDVEAIVGDMDIPLVKQEMVRVGETHSLVLAQKVFGSVGAELGLTIGLPDTVANEIIAAGGRHMGLVDLDAQTRNAMFRLIEKAREEGLGIPDITRRIKDTVSGGRYTSPQIRARLIARTEAKHAQRTSVLSAYKESGRVSSVVVIDNVLGTGDVDCSFWAGRVVTLREADALGGAEHPNGTRDFVPVIA